MEGKDDELLERGADRFADHVDARTFDLRDRRQRALVYERVLREGGAADVLTYIDGALLIDLWDELVLPPGVRAAWRGVVTGMPSEQVA